MDLDIDINNWTMQQLKELFSISDSANKEEINEKTDNLINETKNKEIKSFLIKAKEKVIDNIEWFYERYLTQDDKIQTDKRTDRKQKIDIFSRFPQMKREKLGIENSFSVPHTQGTLNPNVINKITRIISIDSKYRKDVLNTNNGKFTVFLSDPLPNITSLEINSVNIPTSWYNIETSQYNNFIYMDISGSGVNTIFINDGVYDETTLLTTLNTSFSGNIQFTLNSINKHITIENISLNPIEIFFNMDDDNSYYNTTLGWYLGFRKETNQGILLEPGDTYTASGILNIPSFQYLILVVDDFNNNRINSTLVTTINNQEKADIPEYINTESVTCDDNTPFFTQTAPRTLTQAQIYTLNVTTNNQNKIKTRQLDAPALTNVLAYIPVNNNTNSIFITGDDLNDSRRDYFGPVVIDKLEFTLLDQHGRLLNMNGVDWSISLKAEQLYQY